MSAEESGCVQGIIDALGNTNSEVILDFGGQLGDLSGTESIDGTIDFTNAQIQAIALAFGAGYFACTEGENTTTLTLAIGTNNSKEAVSTAGGEAWASLVAATATVVLEDSAEAKQVAIWGGSDLEVGYSTGSAAHAWAVGYDETTESPYLDYGAAEGCPSSGHTNGSCTGGQSGWDQQLEWELSWGINDAYPTPEIYYNPPPGSPVNAEQWTQIVLWAHYALSRCETFEGPLDENEYESSNNATQAWYELKETLESGLGGTSCSTVPEYLSYSLEI